jgi:hypothetical protein
MHIITILSTIPASSATVEHSFNAMEKSKIA